MHQVTHGLQKKYYTKACGAYGYHWQKFLQNIIIPKGLLATKRGYINSQIIKKRIYYIYNRVTMRFVSHFIPIKFTKLPFIVIC